MQMFVVTNSLYKGWSVVALLDVVSRSHSSIVVIIILLIERGRTFRRETKPTDKIPLQIID